MLFFLHFLLIILSLLPFAGLTAKGEGGALVKPSITKPSTPVDKTVVPKAEQNAAQPVAEQGTEQGSAPAESEPAGVKLHVRVEGLENLDKTVLENIDAYLDIKNESDKIIDNQPYLRYLIRSGIGQIQEAVKPFGYYNTTVEPSLFNDQGELYVSYSVNLGEPVIIKTLNLVIVGDAKTDPAFRALRNKAKFQQGDILNQVTYEKLKTLVLSEAAAKGYFDGQFTQHEILLSEDYRSATVKLNYDSGKRYHFNEPTFKHDDAFSPELMKRFAQFHQGDAYDTKKIADTQRDLYNSGYVKQIEVQSTPNAGDKSVDVEFGLEKNKNKKFTYGVGYGTDTGFRLRFDYDWRWVNSKGHKVKARLFLSQYLMDNLLEYQIPGKYPATDYYRFFANQKDDQTGDIDSQSFALGGAYHDKRGSMDREIGIKWQYEDFSLGYDNGTTTLLTPYVYLTHRQADSFLNTHQGWMLSAFVTGAQEGLLSEQSFLQAIGRAKLIKRIKQHKLTAQGAIGQVFSDDFHALPPDYRFFLGGERSIRGYGYEKIGDKDGSGEVIGGSKMIFASSEYEYFFNDSMAAAAFVDVGNAWDAEPSDIKIGAGFGFHYYSIIGPVRLDLAHGFDEDYGDDIRLHLTIGAEL